MNEAEVYSGHESESVNRREFNFVPISNFVGNEVTDENVTVVASAGLSRIERTTSSTSTKHRITVPLEEVKKLRYEEYEASKEKGKRKTDKEHEKFLNRLDQQIKKIDNVMEKKNIENKRLRRMARVIRVGLTCEDIKMIIHDILEYF